MSEFHWIAVAILTVVSASRITRLLTYDKFPPIRWAREKYEDATDGSPWQIIAYCPYCMAPWVSAGVVLSGYFSDWHEVWWLVNAIFAASYLAAILMVHDGDSGEDEEQVEPLAPGYFAEVDMGDVASYANEDFTEEEGSD